MAKKTRKKAPRKARPPLHPIQDIPLHVTASRRYLNYAMSVITSRALPDVRDGLKPVQRRILYSMHHELHLSAGSKPLKCARIVGDVLGKFHPHGDTAVYDALVRMAQNFSLRIPLIDGHGNFGSIDGDGAAAYRYTEATLQQLAMELLSELPRDTVDYRSNYDGKTKEPVVLPAKYPNLLVNGATGIAVGMATNIPPHNLAEVISACEALIQKRSLEVKDLMQYVKGPDFPVGGQILNSRAEIRTIYEEGQGGIRVRAEYDVEEGRTPRIIIRSIPYMVQKDVVVRAIGDLVFARKVPQIVDVRDESTKDIRVVLELKKGSDLGQVMAYLFKHTQLQSNFSVNMTCLVPLKPGASETCTPAKVDLKTMLVHFIDFRFAVVERRFQFDLRKLKERIHILRGFKIVFDALDETIRIIRRSDGRADAAVKLMKRFSLDEIQVNAILDLRLYKLAKLEINLILEELEDKKTRAEKIEKILASPNRLWTIVRKELAELRAQYGDRRRSKIGGKQIQEEVYSEEDFILDEDAYIILSRDGWIKRATRIADKSKIRLRQGDELHSVIAGNTKQVALFFSNFGSVYTTRINDIPPTRGHGDPIQKLFKFRDGEKVVKALSLDPRVLKNYGSADDPEGTEPTNHILALSSSGYTLRCSIAAFAEPSTRTGRRYMRLREGEEVIGAHVIQKKDVVMLATVQGRVLLFRADQAKFLGGAGRGVVAIKLDKNDRVLGCEISRSPSGRMRAITTGNRKVDITTRRYNVTGRGGKGFEVIKRGGLASIEPPEIEIPELPESRRNGTSKNGKRSR